MKSALSQFRAADVSMIKDEKLRAKAHKLQAKEGGFTLLELLVVITLLATLATAALVAYDGIGATAEDTATAANILSAQSLIQNYRAIEDEYPNQWDNLANSDGTTPGTTGVETLLATETQAYFGQWAPAIPAAYDGTSVLENVALALGNVGMDEFQTLDPATTTDASAVPNLTWNESAPGVTAGGASEIEFVFDADANVDLDDIEYDGASMSGNVAFSIVPSAGDNAGTPVLCTADSQTISTYFDGTTTAADNSALNLVNDALDDDVCSLVVAVGFGKDVPGTTLGSKVAITQAPTAGTANVNPAEEYARYIALFQVAEDENEDGTIAASEVFSKARLIGVVDPEGRTIDAALAGANEDA
jgi:prepilin-type N-terminal cleavage/methylation domain-containing protein